MQKKKQSIPLSPYIKHERMADNSDIGIDVCTCGIIPHIFCFSNLFNRILLVTGGVYNR